MIEDGTVIGEDLEEDRKRYHVTETGIVLVTPEMLGQQLFATGRTNQLLEESSI